MQWIQFGFLTIVLSAQLDMKLISMEHVLSHPSLLALLVSSLILLLTLVNNVCLAANLVQVALNAHHVLQVTSSTETQTHAKPIASQANTTANRTQPANHVQVVAQPVLQILIRYQ